jgi:hypothetical protein
MSIEPRSQLIGTPVSYWKVRIQIVEDIFHNKYLSGSGYDPAVRCCERGYGPSISLGSLFYLTYINWRVSGPPSGYGMYEK